MAFPTGWTKRVAITIPAAQVGSGGVSSFTVLLTEANLPAGIFTDARSDGGDIRASTGIDGAGQLAVDLIVWTPASSKAVLRVGTLSLSSAADNTLYIWYGAAAETLPAANSTYGQYAAYDASWAGYWPLQADLNDRTSNARHLANAGVLVPGDSAGKFGQSTSFNGTNQRAYGGQITNAMPVTLIAWVNIVDTRWDGVIRNIGDYGNDAYMLQCRDGATTDAVHNLDATGSATASVAPPSLNTWTQIAASFASTSSRTAAKNGTWGTANTTALTGTFNTTNGGVEIGRGTGWFKGRMQDHQFHTANRGSAWLITEYNQTNAPGSFASVGTIIDVGASGLLLRRRRLMLA
jgi:hypothetical protein